MLVVGRAHPAPRHADRARLGRVGNSRHLWNCSSGLEDNRDLAQFVVRPARQPAAGAPVLLS